MNLFAKKKGITMKRILAFILALLILLAVGCSGSNSAKLQSGDLFDAIAEDRPLPTSTPEVTSAKDEKTSKPANNQTSSTSGQKTKLFCIIADYDPIDYNSSYDDYAKGVCELVNLDFYDYEDCLLRFDIGSEIVTDVIKDAIESGFKEIIWDTNSSDIDLTQITKLYPDVYIIKINMRPKQSYASSNSSSGKEVTSIDWTDIVFSFKDTEGYTFEVTIKLSPWILLSNTSIMEKAWSEVSKGKTLPSYNSWGFKPGIYNYPTIYANRYDYAYSHTGESFCSDGISDMYYSVGTIQIRNKTKDWPITEQNARSLIIPLSCQWDKTVYTGKDHFGFIASKVYYSGQTNVFVGGIRFDPSINKDNWGPATFLLMTAEVFSPNFPDGAYYNTILDHLVIGGTSNYVGKTQVPETRLGIIGKDQKYVLPASRQNEAKQSSQTSNQSSETVRKLYVLADYSPVDYIGEDFVRESCDYYGLDFDDYSKWNCSYNVTSGTIHDIVQNAVNDNYTDIILDVECISEEDIASYATTYPHVHFYYYDGIGFNEEYD